MCVRKTRPKNFNLVVHAIFCDACLSLYRGEHAALVARYPVIYVLCWVFTLINGIEIILVAPANASLSLVLLATITARLQVML